MRKTILWILLPLLSLNACSLNPRTTNFTAGNAAIELPAQTQLILGIIQLEETENAVSAKQAQELLPMFYILKNLNESDTAAQEEIDGLTNQIKETLTEKQIQAIEAMSFSRQDMMSLMRGGGETAKSQNSASASGGNMGGPPEMGGMPGGMGAPPEMGGMPNSGNQASSANADKTSRADSITTKTPSALFDTLIKLLEKKIQ
ncbi:MAG: hypothetical protein LDL51_05065 [Chloroflexi bacterium]|nr:hypothetical protein [Chloroflexota bacterium]